MVEKNRNTLEALHEKHRRLALLRTLRQLPGYAANVFLLRDHLDDMGLVASYDMVRADIQRLNDIGLCSASASDESLRITLTEQGMDVAEGRSDFEDVRKPEPECPY